MKQLSLENFLYVNDFERNQYTILEALKNYKNDFQHYRLYPGLSELSELSLAFKELDKDEIRLMSLYNQKLNKSVYSAGTPYLEPIEMDDQHIENVFALIEWAKPLIAEIIDEGKVIYRFVKENIAIEELSDSVSEKNEGLMLVTNNEDDVIQVLRYELAMLSKGQIRYKDITIFYVDEIDKEKFTLTKYIPFSEFSKEYSDNLNLATFICKTELDFPFDETILPVAKRKLISQF